MVPRLELQQHNCSLCLTQRHMEEESVRMLAGNILKFLQITRQASLARHGKPSATDSKQAWHDGLQLEMRCARQRDDLGIAVWKRGQPKNWDDQTHPETFLLHMHIVSTAFAIVKNLGFSFFHGFRRPNLITGLSRWRTPD